MGIDENVAPLLAVTFNLWCVDWTSNYGPCERKPQEVVRILVNQGEAWLQV